MKITILGTLMLLTSCGAVNNMCNNLFGKLPKDSLSDSMEKQRERDRLQDERLTELENGLVELINEVDGIKQSILVIQASLGDLEASFTSSGINLNQLETNVADLLSRVSDLEDNLYIVQVKPPCPNSKEVIIELSNGEFIAYFENHGKRYLSKLEHGNYQTSDGTHCHFSI